LKFRAIDFIALGAVAIGWTLWSYMRLGRG
jgi:hypothetical protein